MRPMRVSTNMIYQNSISASDSGWGMVGGAGCATHIHVTYMTLYHHPACIGHNIGQ